MLQSEKSEALLTCLVRLMLTCAAAASSAAVSASWTAGLSGCAAKASMRAALAAAGGSDDATSSLLGECLITAMSRVMVSRALLEVALLHRQLKDPDSGISRSTA